MHEASPKSIVVYDGQCAFCSRQIERIRRRDRTDRFEYVPRQTEGLDRRFPGLAKSDFETGLRLIDLDGAIHVGADAVYRIFRLLRPWKWVAWLYRVPGLTQLARTIYAWIAANRHRLGTTCPDSRERPSNEFHPRP